MNHMFKMLAGIMLAGAMILGVSVPTSTAFAADPAPAVCAPCVQQALQNVRTATVDPTVVRMIDVAKMEAMALSAEDAASNRAILERLQADMRIVRRSSSANADAIKAIDMFDAEMVKAFEALKLEVAANTEWRLKVQDDVATIPQIRTDLAGVVSDVQVLKEQMKDVRRLRFRVGGVIGAGVGANIAYGEDKLITRDTYGSVAFGDLSFGAIGMLDIRLDDFDRPLIFDVRMGYEHTFSDYRAVTGMVCLGGYVGKKLNGSFNACALAGHTWGGDVFAGGLDANTLGVQAEARKYVTKPNGTFQMAFAPFLRADVSMGQSTRYLLSSFYGGHPAPQGITADNFSYPSVRTNALQGMVGVTIFVVAGNNRAPN